jgi:hypothetical protein
MADTRSFCALANVNASSGAWVQLAPQDLEAHVLLYGLAAFDMVIVSSGTNDAAAAAAENTAARRMVFNGGDTHSVIRINPSRTWVRANGASSTTVTALVMP